MPSRFMVSRAARAVGMQVILPAASSSASFGGDRFDLGHDQVRLLLFDQRGQRRAVGHVDHVGAVRDLVAGRIGVAVDCDHFRRRGAAAR
jgi:hypothetical protein